MSSSNAVRSGMLTRPYVGTGSSASNWRWTCAICASDSNVTVEARATGMFTVAGCERVYAIADEDLPRENDEKTSSVHFVRFELTPAMIAALKSGAGLAIGVDHPEYTATLEPVPHATRTALLADLA